MSSGIKCPECGGFGLIEPKYIKGSFVEFLAEGNCILCGFSIDAKYLYNQVYENTQDLFTVLYDSPRSQHDKSLQDVTLRDYPDFVKTLKKALELSNEEDEEFVREINLSLGMIYRELAFYTRTVEETYDYCTLATKHTFLAFGMEVGPGRFEIDFIRLARSKVNLDWWVEKCELLKEILKVLKELTCINAESEYEAEDALLVGEVYYEYAMSLGDVPEAKNILKEAIKKFESAIAWSNMYWIKPYYYYSLNESLCTCLSYEYLGKIYVMLEEPKKAFAHYVLAEQSSSYIENEILAPPTRERIAVARQNLEDKLSGDSIAEAKEFARKSFEALEHKSWEKKADESSLKCRDRLLSLLHGLEGKLNRRYYEKLRISLDNLEKSFPSVRRLAEDFEIGIYRKLFGSYPRGKRSDWSKDFYGRLNKCDAHAEVLLRFIYRFSSCYCHYTKNPPALEDVELLYIALTRFMDWYLAFNKE